ncbi:MAG: GntR family transcriptional regulator [Spirochaetaceae bacterium]|jgi:DNA-binding transcriptional regulator YhcF (GntR family)|nr:GntR family transcriptional regulator [Spirochaetaceae bacterium]
MYITIDTTKPGPLYQQIVDQISRDIALNSLSPGYQLPTVRQLAAESGISPGTIKHAYDMLEQAGLIIKNRGSGTFVASPHGADKKGAKAQAMQAIDDLLIRLKELAFSPRDIRIFLDLKLREWEEQSANITVAAVDCSPEALSAMYQQIADLPHTEVFKFLLEDVLNDPKRFDPGTDLVVTTSTHYEDLIKKMAPDGRPSPLVMAIATSTALELAGLPPDTLVGVISVSRRFAQIMLRACDQYGKLINPPRLAFFDDEERVSQLIQECGRLLLPPNYYLFAPPVVVSLLKSCEQAHRIIHYCYQVERGSLLYLEEQVNRLFRTRNE